MLLWKQALVLLLQKKNLQYMAQNLSAATTKRRSVAFGLHAITGGLGGLGLRAVQMLVEDGASGVVTDLLRGSQTGIRHDKVTSAVPAVQFGAAARSQVWRAHVRRR